MNVTDFYNSSVILFFTNHSEQTPAETPFQSVQACCTPTCASRRLHVIGDSVNNLGTDSAEVD